MSWSLDTWYPSGSALSSHQAVFDGDDQSRGCWVIGGHLCSVITNHHLCHNNQVMRVINSPAHVNIYSQGYFTNTNTQHHHIARSSNAIRKQKYYWDVIEIFIKYLFWFGYCLLHHGYCGGAGLTVFNTGNRWMLCEDCHLIDPRWMSMDRKDVFSPQQPLDDKFLSNTYHDWLYQGGKDVECSRWERWEISYIISSFKITRIFL